VTIGKERKNSRQKSEIVVVKKSLHGFVYTFTVALKFFPLRVALLSAALGRKPRRRRL
jgi:hypothetical protein